MSHDAHASQPSANPTTTSTTPTTTATEPHRPLEHIRAEKAQLRKRIKAQLTALTPDQLRTESHHTTQLLLTHPTLAQLLSTTPAIALYLSMPTAEFDTTTLLNHCFATNKRVFLPRTTSPTTMHFLEVHTLQEVLSLPANSWGIREPPPHTADRAELLSCVEEVGLCIVPGVAFTADGRRLGHGRGYYDRYLQAWDEARRERGLAGAVPTAALALRCQLVEHVPVTEHDRRIDHVIHASLQEEKL